MKTAWQRYVEKRLKEPTFKRAYEAALKEILKDKYGVTDAIRTHTFLVTADKLHTKVEVLVGPLKKPKRKTKAGKSLRLG